LPLILSPPPMPFLRPNTSADSDLSPSLGFFLVYGALSLGLVSVLAYSLWAFRLIRGEPLLYSARPDERLKAAQAQTKRARRALSGQVGAWPPHSPGAVNARLGG
jgi:hypothetical protein